MKYLILAITFNLIINSNIVNAQDNNPVKIFVQQYDSLLNGFAEKNPSEKVFLQTDKEYYLAGETIWMKAWCTLEGKPSFLSQILYVEMVNEKGEVVKKNMYKLDSLSSTQADIEISTELSSGNYSINAYTLWMLNYPSFIYRKPIFIYGKSYLKNKQPAISKPEDDIKINFFPEGGNILSGASNRIAFKAISGNGIPIQISGYISDSTGNKLTDFSSEWNGMGQFEIDASDKITYYANIPLMSGKIRQFKLPAAISKGISLKVENNSPARLYVIVNKSLNHNIDKIKILAQIQYQVVFAAELNLSEGQNTIAIPKKGLPPGIMHITAFAEDGFPLSDRMAFIENYTFVTPNLQKEERNTNPRSKNQISFSIPGSDQSSISVSALVTNMPEVDSNYYSENILSSLLLTSDLPGYISNSGYYFKDKSPLRLHHIDLLLMTNGWTRYSWKKLIEHDAVPLKYPVETNINIKGIVSKPGTRVPVTSGKVDFIVKSEDSTTLLAEARLTDRGEFILQGLDYKKSASIAYQGTNEKKEKLVVDVNLYPSYIDTLKRTSFRVSPLNLDTIDMNAKSNYFSRILNKGLAQIDTSSKNGFTYLGNVTVTAKRVSKEDSLNNTYTSGAFMNGKAVMPEQYPNYQSIWKMIQVAIPGVSVEGDPYNPTVSFTRYAGVGNNFGTASLGTEDENAPSGIIESSGIAYYLNEINVSKDVISSLIVDDIALIKVLKSEAGVLGATQGAIAIYTKKGADMRKSILDKEYTKVERLGYSLVKDFYNMDYEAVPDLNKGREDNRITLFWSPKLKPWKDGKYRIRYFNNDSAKKVKVIIQGIDTNGNLFLNQQTID